jgi:hypothetical protein
MHEYLRLSLNRAIEALNQLDSVERFADIVRRLEAE